MDPALGRQSGPLQNPERPQLAVVELVSNGELRSGRILDIGCGTGDDAIYLAKNGLSVVGLDPKLDAVKTARAKAARQSAEVDFFVGNGGHLTDLFRDGEFDVVIDTGFFRTLSEPERHKNVQQVHRVLGNGGRYYLICFSEKEYNESARKRLSPEDLKRTLGTDFRLNYIRNTVLESGLNTGGAMAYLVSSTKTFTG